MRVLLVVAFVLIVAAMALVVWDEWHD